MSRERTRFSFQTENRLARFVQLYFTSDESEFKPLVITDVEEIGAGTVIVEVEVSDDDHYMAILDSYERSEA